MWYLTFDSTFFVTIVTILTGSFALMLKYCLKSKCDKISCCCGLIKIHRIVEIEENNNDIELNNIEEKKEENNI